MFFVLDALWELWLPPHIVTARTSAILNYSIEEYFLSALVFTGTGRAYSLCFLSSSFVMVRFCDVSLCHVPFLWCSYPFRIRMHRPTAAAFYGNGCKSCMKEKTRICWSFLDRSREQCRPTSDLMWRAYTISTPLVFNWNDRVTAFTIPPGFLLTSKRRFLRP